MRAERREVVGVSLAVGQRGEMRRQSLTLLARLDSAHALQESAAPLGQAAVDLRVAEPGGLADLLVAEALGLEKQAAHLLWLQPLERLGAEPQSLEALCVIVGVRR